MTRRRKVLCVAILIFSMLLQCIMPLTTVNATTSVEVTLNSSNLYEAVKRDLQRQNISAQYSDATRTVTVDVSKVQNLYLSNSEIEDLTGLDKFTELTYLNLHANKLTKDSNLQVIDNLTKLTYLDLSTNGIASVSSITRFDSIKEADITNQEITYNEFIVVDTGDGAESYPKQVEISLPDILLKDGGTIKREWLTITFEGEGQLPTVDWDKSLKNGSATLVINTADGSADGYKALKGTVKIDINIDDNPRSKLANTRISYFFTIVDEKQEGIVFKDENLYYAVKEQLTRGQDVNNELKPLTNERNLYTQAIDDALTLVIEENDLINNITSLILHDKEIRDLTGLEYFIGLTTELNISYNYISTFEKVRGIAENLNKRNAEIGEKIKEVLESLNAEITKYDEQMEIIKEAKRESYELKKLGDIGGDDGAKDLAQKIAEFEKTIKDAENKATTIAAEIEKYVNSIHKIYDKEYRLISLLPIEVMSLKYDKLTELTKEEAKEYVDKIVEKVTAIEKGDSLTEYENWAIRKLLDIWAKENDLLFEVTEKDYDIGGDYEVEEKDIPIDCPIGKFFEKIKDDSNLTLGDYQELIYIFKAVESLSQIENYTIVKRLYAGTDGGANTKDYSEEAIKDIEEVLKLNDFDTYFFDKIGEKKESLTEECKPDDCKETKGYELNLKKGEGDALFTVQISINEGEYSKQLDENTNYKVLLGHRYSLITDDDLAKLICSPGLRLLNMSDNNIGSIYGLDLFRGLKKLEAYKSAITDISEVDWSVFTQLEELYLGYNQISDATPLDVITSLKKLDLSANLLSGKFNLNLVNMKDLEVADFSDNQIEDIGYLTEQFLLIAKGYDEMSDGTPDNLSVKDYLTKIGLKVNFQYQKLTLEGVASATNGFVEVNLPMIFRQVKEWDYLKASFGIDSLGGLVSSDGYTVRLRVDGNGSYYGRVTIEGQNGYGENSIEGIGYGTYCDVYIAVNGSSSVGPNRPPVVDDDNPGAPVDFGFEVKDDIVLVYEPKVTVDEFIERFLDKDKYKVTVSNSVSDTKLGTGAIVTVTNLNGDVTFGAYELVVKGDLNGDGDVDASDSIIIRQVIADTTQLTGIYNSAADVNDDGEIDSQDSILILRYRADLISSFK